MSPVPEPELVALQTLSGYDQMLEIDRLCRVYGTDEASVRAAMAQLSAASATSTTAASPTSWDTSHKEVPDVQQAVAPAAPNLVDKTQFRFEYDPTREAAARRDNVNQAILCQACGVALGIPDVRPIKVTCPSCLFETTYTH
jgi:formylmethanofuran dehydrogenase subunit E